MTEAKNELLTQDHLVKGMVKACLEQIKSQQKPWEMMSEEEQQRTIDALAYDMKGVALDAIDMIVAEGSTTLHANLDKVTVKNGIQAVLKLDGHAEGRHELVDREGKDVVIIIPLADNLIREDGMPTADPDQAGLDLDTQSDDDKEMPEDFEEPEFEQSEAESQEQAEAEETVGVSYSSQE